jgi:serine/threonine-protein kinase RsbW/stage II sporulation protein AB (anti-sigma F factor)
MVNPGEGFSQSYPATPDSVPSVRNALTAFAAHVGADGRRLEAIRLAASEAVTNCVLHAYKGRRGRIQVGASQVGDEFWLFVADDGSGLRPRGRHSGLGLGLALIAQLADEFQILSRSTGGTELRMQFKLDDHGPADGRNGAESGQLRGSVSSAAVPA